MLIVPKGAPAWTRTVDIGHYDGDPNKENFLNQGVVDPLTDVGAEGFSRMVSDLAACVRVAPFCELEILCNDTTPAAPTVVRALMQTGIREVPYAGNAPPSGFPAVARNGDGDFTITFASSYADEYGVVGAFQVSCPQASLFSGLGFVAYEIPSPTTLRVRAFLADGTTPIDDARVRVSCLSGA